MRTGHLVLALAATLAAAVTAAFAAVAPDAAAENGAGFIGVLFADANVDVASSFDGRLTSVPVRLGDLVRRGEVVATLDDRPLRQDLAMANADLVADKAALDKARLELDVARKRYERRSGVDAREVFSGEEIAEAKDMQRSAEASVAMAEARIVRQEAEVKRLREQLALAKLTAPVDGRVAARFHDPGASVQAREPVIRVVSAGGLWVRFAVPADVSRDVVAGRTVRVSLLAPQSVVHGTVRNIAPQVDAASGMVFVEAELQPPSAAEVPPVSGMTARVFLE